MFSPTHHHHIPPMHHHCHPTPPPVFGCMTIAPRMNFAMGIAMSTSGFIPMYPYFGGASSLFSYPMYNATPIINTPMSPMITPYSMMSMHSTNLLNAAAWGQNLLNTLAATSIQNQQMNYMSSFQPFSSNITSFPMYQIQRVNTINSSNNNMDNSNIRGNKISKNNDKYGPEFLARVKEIAAKVNCNYRDLLAVMNSESGINSKAKNPNGTATGLIQFIESTAQGLGTSTAELYNMTPLQQLDYVEKFLVTTKAQAGFSADAKLSGGDLYSLVFLPGRAQRNVLTSAGESYYRHNSGLDRNKDGQITKTELNQRVRDFYVSDNSFLA